MAKKESEKGNRGLSLPFAGKENYELGRQFLENPNGFLRRTKLSHSDLKCPDEVHKAMQRGEAFAKAAATLGSPADDLKKVEPIKQLAAKHFGKDFEVAVIPFGLKFRERLQPIRGQDWTVTASGTITFVDTDTDVDE